MKRKLFIGIDLDPFLKKMLAKSIDGWRDLPVRWHPESSLHLTLLYLGYVHEDQMDDVADRIEEVCSEKEAFDVQFERIELGYKDAEKKHDPKDAKLVWLTGTVSEELKDLRQGLEENFDMFVREKKIFRPHVTLGRMRMKKWQEQKVFPVIAQDMQIALDISTVTLFESVRIDNKISYEPIGTFELLT